MEQKTGKGLYKHRDFILIDIVCLQLSFALAYFLNVGPGNPYGPDSYRVLAILLFFAQALVILFSDNYNGVLRRGYLKELTKVLWFTIGMLLISALTLFVLHIGTYVSRLQLGITLVLYVLLSYCSRIARKKQLHGRQSRSKESYSRSMVVVTSKELVDEALYNLRNETVYNDRYVSGFVLMDGGASEIQDKYDIPVIDLDRAAINRIRSKWVDEVLIYQPSTMEIDRKFLIELADMGMTVHFTLALFNDNDWPPMTLQKIGRLKVLTSSIRFTTPQKAMIKRLADIVGALIGCLITCILFIFVAPAIYIKSPGPIFFKQKRIGKGGKPFDMYKFRSMYLDAEERKATLMKENKMQGLMFKMDDDPRIIGSEKKDKNGKPKGIGNFIRNTSIDEFPQFFNVLKGDMSLVGTRPPTLEEFEQYDAHHRARMTIRPGITGLWQVSGRNEITDFEQVVRLDREYIENWSLYLDTKILLKTVFVVLARKGAN